MQDEFLELLRIIKSVALDQYKTGLQARAIITEAIKTFEKTNKRII